MTRLLNATHALSFVTAGNARLTLVSAKTGTRYTFRVRAADNKDVWFISTLFGPDNESDYAYMALLAADKRVRVTAKSRFKPDSPQVRAFTWAMDHLKRGTIPAALEIWHEGACGRCGRALTVPESIASGIGPECAKKVYALPLCEAA